MKGDGSIQTLGLTQNALIQNSMSY